MHGKKEQLLTVESKLKYQLINIYKPGAFSNFTTVLYELMQKKLLDGYVTPVFVCIGSDRSTGDSLGPLVGYKIEGIRNKNVHIYGTLERPVHAKNLETTIKEINEKHEKPLVIAIDACLGNADHVGCISVSEQPIKPGLALNKNLPPVGDISIMGFVNISGFMDFLTLQNTRLYIVMSMADFLANGIRYVLWKMQRYNQLFC